MRIAFNASALLLPLTGIGQYCKYLLQSLQGEDGINLDMFYAKAWSKNLRLEPLPASITRFKPIIRRVIPNSYAINRKFQQFYFSSGVKKNNFDLYHEPNFLAFDFDGPIVLTVHDLSWIRFPEVHPIERVRAMNKYFESSLRRANIVITDSEFVKYELMDLFNVDESKIQPVALGVSAKFRPMSILETQSLLSELKLKYGEYFLAVGTLEPRKNLKVAINAYLNLPLKTRQKYPFVLVGMRGWLTDDFYRKIDPYIASGEIRQLGYLTDDNLVKVVAGSCALIYPSIYEGFGLPPLEAMACAIPVITSNAASLPEVVKDAGLMFNHDDVDGFSHAMNMTSSSDQFRQSLASKSLEQSRLFSWDSCAQGTINAYKKALEI